MKVFLIFTHRVTAIRYTYIIYTRIMLFNKSFPYFFFFFLMIEVKELKIHFSRKTK